MKFYQLHSISLEEAKEKQFNIVDNICKHFDGQEILTRGDLGVKVGLNMPKYTKKAENTIADIFNTEDCILVRGSGTGAIRYGLHSIIKADENLLVHDAPIYSTTKSSLDMLGINPIKCNFNNLYEIKEATKNNLLSGALIQYTRQRPDDLYEMKEVIRTIKDNSQLPVLTDDNYAVMKVNKIGVELGADLSCFSSFKLLGPEGVGIIVGKKKYIEEIRKIHYSGGMQVQGHEALSVLQGLIYSPVMLAIQAEVLEQCIDEIKKGMDGVKDAYLANSQSKVLLVEFEDEIREEVLEEASKLGAAPYPIGSESKYEFVPMFYRVSGTFIEYDKSLKKRMIRINPMRSGKDTIIRILKESILRVRQC